MNLSEEIGRRSPSFVWLCALGLLIMGVAARFLVPPQFSVAFIFLLPISFASWFLSWKEGSAVALAGAAFLFYFDLKFTTSGTAGAYWDGFINLTVASAFIYIFAELRALYHRQIDLSRRDPLTGLLNRRALLEMIAIETRRIARHRRPLTLAYIDVDNFKLINDRYGHSAGDEFLRTLGRQMASRLRLTDSLARVGGDEFAILLPETELGSARLVLSDIHRALQRSCDDYSCNATTSIGAVTFPSGMPPEAMIEMADEAMYDIKRNGKNKVEYKLAG